MTIILLVGVIFQFFFFPFILNGDGIDRFRLISQFTQTGKFVQTKYSIIGPLMSYPLVLLDIIRHTNFFVLRYNFFLLLAGSFVLFILMNKLVHKRLLIVFLILIFFASMFPGHIINYYGDVFSVLLMAVGFVLIETKHALFGWPLMVLSVGNTPATFIPLLFICLYKIVREKKFIFILLPIITFFVFLVDTKLRYPNLVQEFSQYVSNDKGFVTVLPYSGKPGFSYPMVLGVLNELFSFGKGLLFFAPGLLFSYSVWKQIKEKVIKNIYVLWWIYLVGLILVYSKWWAWYGGWFWGPRFLLFASIPASFNLAYVLTNSATTAKVKTFALLVALWSFWVGVNGVIFGQTGLDICTGNNYALEHLCWYTPEFSVLFHPIVVRLPINTFGWFMIVYSICLWCYIAVMTYFRTKKVME